MSTLKKGTVITIGRAFGSGGRAIGKKLAELLAIPYYDGEILEEMSKKSGLRKDFLKTFDEKRAAGFMYSLDAGGAAGFYGTANTLGEQVYKTQVDTIKELAAKSPCIMVGRRADRLLAEDFNVVSVFISAPEEYRIAHVIKRDGGTKNEAAKRIKRADRERASYYNFFGEGLWGKVDNYDLCINSARLTTDEAAGLLMDYLKARGVAE